MFTSESSFPKGKKTYLRNYHSKMIEEYFKELPLAWRKHTRHVEDKGRNV